MNDFVERPGRPGPPDLLERRRGLAAAMAAGYWRTDPAPVEVTLDGVRALRFEPPEPPRAVVLHFHGGGFRIGAPEAVAPFAAALAARSMVTVICPAYRLAPEHPFPAGLRDAHRAMTTLQAASAGPLILSGDSAGGGLAAGLTVLSVSARAPVAGLALLSAWLDLSLASACYEDNAATDPVFSRASAIEAADLYLQGAPARNALASPLFADLAGFPPSFISVGSGEVLADDSRRFHAALLAAGATSTLSEIPGMEHVAVTRGFQLPGAAETFQGLADFIGRVIGQG